jgi:hypothetical protein
MNWRELVPGFCLAVPVGSVVAMASMISTQAMSGLSSFPRPIPVSRVKFEGDALITEPYTGTGRRITLKMVRVE